MTEAQAVADELRFRSEAYFLGRFPGAHESSRASFAEDMGRATRNASGIAVVLGVTSSDYSDVERDAVSAARGVWG